MGDTHLIQSSEKNRQVYRICTCRIMWKIYVLCCLSLVFLMLSARLLHNLIHTELSSWTRTNDDWVSAVLLRLSRGWVNSVSQKQLTQSDLNPNKNRPSVTYASYRHNDRQPYYVVLRGTVVRQARMWQLAVPGTREKVFCRTIKSVLSVTIDLWFYEKNLEKGVDWQEAKRGAKQFSTNMPMKALIKNKILWETSNDGAEFSVNCAKCRSGPVAGRRALCARRAQSLVPDNTKRSLPI